MRGRSVCLSPPTSSSRRCWFGCCGPRAVGAKPKTSFKAHCGDWKSSTWCTPAPCAGGATAASSRTRQRADARIDRTRPDAALARPAAHEVQFCTTSDGVRIAYACVGAGPPVVWAAHWMSHLSFSWESPIWRHWTEEFARDHAFVHYDERGNGLSDWDVPPLLCRCVRSRPRGRRRCAWLRSVHADWKLERRLDRDCLCGASSGAGDASRPLWHLRARRAGEGR